jgi:Ca-activated chloride channel family protein
MLVVDSSRSMTAIDFSRDGQPVSRMQVVKGVMSEFIDSRVGDRLGLIIFGNNAYVVSPLTLDRNAVKQQLNDLAAGIVGDATAMGDAIALGVSKLRQRPQGSRVLILVADGDNNAGLIPPREAARLAATEQVRIYAIGVASTEDTVRMLATDYRTYEEAGDMALDEDVLREISESTGGAYFRATDSAALAEIYQRIDQLEKSEVEATTMLIPHPLYRWPLAVALLALLALGLFPGGRLRHLQRGAHG